MSMHALFVLSTGEVQELYMRNWYIIGILNLLNHVLIWIPDWIQVRSLVHVHKRKCLWSSYWIFDCYHVISYNIYFVQTLLHRSLKASSCRPTVCIPNCHKIHPPQSPSCCSCANGAHVYTWLLDCLDSHVSANSAECLLPIKHAVDEQS